MSDNDKLKIIAAFIAACVILFRIGRSIKRIRNWQSGTFHTYVFCGTTFTGLLILSKCNIIRTDQIYFDPEQVYYPRGINVSRLELGHVYSFKSTGLVESYAEANSDSVEIIPFIDTSSIIAINHRPLVVKKEQFIEVVEGGP